MILALDRFSVQLQAQLASGMAGAGLVWAAKVATAGRLGIRTMIITPGLVELLCASILIWLTAKWRSARLNRKPVTVTESR